jgi:hypothetical protein
MAISAARSVLDSAPVIRLLLVVQSPDASDMSPVAILLGPFDCVELGLEGRESVICVGFDYVILDIVLLLVGRSWSIAISP